MSNKLARTLEAKAVTVPNGHLPIVEIGPATLNVFSQVLTQADVSKAQILTILEERGLLGKGNYRLVLSGRLVPADDEP